MFQELTLRDFRNYQSSTLSFGHEVNIFLGKNGQGKTNILEALQLLACGQSFRFGDNETFIRHNSEQANLKSKLKISDLEYELQLQILKSKKNYLLNGKKATVQDLSEKVSTVIFSPESLSAIKDGSDTRRNLLDELLISIHKRNAEIIRDFRKSLKTKNRILRDYSQGLATKNETQELLESLNPIYFKHATELTVRRLEAIRQISNDLNFAMQKISKNLLETKLEYLVSKSPVIHFTHQDIHILLKKRAEELKEAELSSGTSLVGPHKHDLNFLYNQKDSRFFCSQGQQRALILAFKMAQIVYHCRVHGAYPLLMLDDVLSELDEEKRESLIGFLQQVRTQIFLTTTDLNLTGDLAVHDCRIFDVEEGMINEHGYSKSIWSGFDPSLGRT